MTVQETAAKYGCSNMTVQRRLKAAGMDYSIHADVPDDFVIQKGKTGRKHSAPTKAQERPKITRESKLRRLQRISTPYVSKSNLSAHLSRDWLAITVICTLLLVDVFSFSVIGHNRFSQDYAQSGIAFGIIGFACGIGSVVTYNRIKDEAIANRWKYVFACFQFFVFLCAANKLWTVGEVVLSLMFVVVFVGVQKSVKQ